MISAPTTLAFVGVGLMGNPMATHLINAGFSLRLWNRTQAKLAPFAERAVLCATPAEAVAEADVVVSMLETGQVVDEVLYQSKAYQQARPNTLFIDMSSIAPAMARSHAARVSEHGMVYVDAPVSGGTVGAEAAELSIMAGGEADAVARAQAVFACLGRAVHIGPAGAGQLAKLANQAIVGITIGAVAEALLLSSAGGADAVAVREALLGGFANSRILALHGERMLTRQFEPGATARVQLKDLETILAEAKQYDLELPLVTTVCRLYRDMVAHGHEGLDHSGLLLELEAINQQRFQVRGR